MNQCGQQVQRILTRADCSVELRIADGFQPDSECGAWLVPQLNEISSCYEFGGIDFRGRCLLQERIEPRERCVLLTRDSRVGPFNLEQRKEVGMSCESFDGSQ